ncbi:MAG: hypothetical protein ACK5PS_01445 [Desulfopila sp.]
MMRIVPLLLVLVSLCSCVGRGDLEVPALRPPAAMTAEEAAVAAPVLFPEGHWQFVHDIRFVVDGGGGGSAIGVLDLDDQAIGCVLMTVEGLVLFAGRSVDNGPVEVSRAQAPFDRPGFAAGLLDDIRLIFRQPAGNGQRGHLADGVAVLRHQQGDLVTDILQRDDDCWTVESYRRGEKQRTVRARNCRVIDATTIPGDIELVNRGRLGYTLYLHLLSAERLAAANR